jgi:maleate isomerase
MTGLGRRRIVVVSPYPDSLDELALKYWDEAGLDVVEVVNIVPPGGSIYAIHDENVARAVLARPVPEDAAIALCGTGMATAGQLWRIRRATGVPCVSYNSAIAWWLLREVGPFAAPGPVDSELSTGA